MKQIILARFNESISVKKQLVGNVHIINLILKISTQISNSIQKNNKVIFAGNGGSFSDSCHLAAEFVCRFNIDRFPMPSVSLASNNSILTAIGNDYSFTDIFSRELQAIGKLGDIFIAISTSGNSPNILKAIKAAKSKSIETYGLTGINGGKMKDLCECICVPSNNTARIQEAHIVIGHIICELVENAIFK